MLTDAEGRRWWRPPHYLVVVWDADHDHCGHDDDLDEVDCTKGRYEVATKGAFNDEANAREEADNLADLDYEVALFDNWAGVWLIEPPARWGIEPIADGFARYDLRPGGRILAVTA